MVSAAWQKGFVYVGTLERGSANYLAGYVTKKMTSAGDERLKGRHPEFARMSLRPGIGGDAMWDVSSVLLEHSLDKRLVDVPSGLRHGSAEKPLGRYLQNKLREQIGRRHGVPDEVLEELDAEMLPLREAAKNSEDNPSLASRVVEKNQGKIDRAIARSEIFKSRRVF